MHQHESHRPLEKKGSLARAFGRRLYAGSGKDIRNQLLDRRLVAARHRASRVTRQIGELHRDPRKAGAGIPRLRRPFCEILEKRVEHLVRPA